MCAVSDAVSFGSHILIMRYGIRLATIYLLVKNLMAVNVKQSSHHLHAYSHLIWHFD